MINFQKINLNNLHDRRVLELIIVKKFLFHAVGYLFTISSVAYISSNNYLIWN